MGHASSVEVRGGGVFVGSLLGLDGRVPELAGFGIFLGTRLASSHDRGRWEIGKTRQACFDGRSPAFPRGGDEERGWIGCGLEVENSPGGGESYCGGECEV